MLGFGEILQEFARAPVIGCTRGPLLLVPGGITRVPERSLGVFSLWLLNLRGGQLGAIASVPAVLGISADHGLSGFSAPNWLLCA
jgi:hypothetical protein